MEEYKTMIADTEESDEFEFAAVLQDIRLGLSGNDEKDKEYLERKIKEYQNTKYASEVRELCTNLLQNMENKMDDDELARIMQVIFRTRYLLAVKNCEEAENTIMPLVDDIEKRIATGKYDEDDTCVHCCFDELYENVLYDVYLNKDQKKIEFTDEIPFTEIYLCYADVLTAQEKYAEAEGVLIKALKWNPVNSQARFRYIELLKKIGEHDRFLKETVDLFRFVFTRDHLAHCYRNLADHFIEEKKWKNAIACLSISLNYDEKSEEAIEKLQYIESVADEVFTAPTIEEVMDLAEQYGFPVGPYPMTARLAIELGMKNYEDGNDPYAHYYLNIAYDLTEDDEIRKILDKITESDCCRGKHLS